MNIGEIGIQEFSRNIGNHQKSERCESSPSIQKTGKESMSVLSLFSGCGGLDLGFEGDFTVKKQAVNPAVHPEWQCMADVDSDWIHLPKTQFHTVFANDINRDARTAWTAHFRHYGIPSDIYRLESIVDLVKKQRAGERIFPNQIDVVTGGFPCQDLSHSVLK